MSNNIKIDKEALKQAIKRYKGNVSEIAESLSVSRQTVYNYLKEDEDMWSLLTDARENIIDFAESKLLKLIEQENAQVIMFTLKTLGKNRGYVEKSEIDQTQKTINIIEVPKLDAYEPTIDEITDSEIN
tara:strand:+ start:156 stop:542 length:387 start_codon:yes stop_codon:yes gene_type:complete